MGIRFLCPNGHKLNVKAYLAGERGICPQCDAKFLVPSESGGQAEALVEAADGTTTDDIPEVAITDSAPSTAAPPAAVPPPPPAPSSTATPPPSEVPAEVWYVRTATGEQFGPAPLETMQSWVAEGRVTADCWVWRTGWAEWKSGGQAITYLNVLPPDARLADPPSAVPGLENLNTGTPHTDLPSEEPSDVTLPSAEPTPGQLPADTNPTVLYQTTKRLRQERARKVTFLLGAIVVLLFAILIIVLMKD